MRTGEVHSGLARYLPYLRRHARALAGEQAGGDAFVRATLEAIAADPERERLARNARLYLFRAFHAQWTVHRGTVGCDPSFADPLGRDLVGREALLLTAIEGMTVEEAAEVLDRDADEVEEEIDAARRAISDAIRSRVLIIEDEPIIMMHLEQIVENMGHSIAATATTRDDAVREAARVAPDLVLADIHLADGSSGIDAAQEILSRFDVPVVFVTAYPERLLTGERPEPTYLVTKPFEASTIIATVGQALLARQRGIAPA